MGVLAGWKRKRRLNRSIADFGKDHKQQRERELILEWYKLLEPFHRRVQHHHGGKHAQLMALADDLSRNAVSDVVWTFIWFGGAWTVIFALIILFGHVWQWKMATLFALGLIGIVILAFKTMKREMRNNLERLVEGYWVAHDPFTGKEIYGLLKCPECVKQNYTNAYLRNLEPCEYCGHNIDWEAAKLK
jgi:hypothetical protein